MTIKVIGAGLGRTGTSSLKLVLEQLLSGSCYHMTELFDHLEEHTPTWHAAVQGKKVEWDTIFSDYCAIVDEPGAMLWQELMDYYPDALVILSLRNPASWWKSANATILPIKQKAPPTEPPELVAWHTMVMELYSKVYPSGVNDPEATQQGFLDHNERVKAGVPKHRLLIWQVEDGWEPICKALNLPIPKEAFPHLNTTADFQAREIHDI